MGASSSPGAGTTTLTGGAALDTSAANLLLNRSLTNAAGSTATLSGSTGLNLISNANAFWTNQGTFTFASDAGIAINAATGTFNNSGTFQKTGGTGTSTVSWNFSNSGTVTAQSGTLSFTVGQTLSNFSAGTLTGGTWRAASGGTLTIGATRNVTTVAAGTTVEVNGATSSFPNLSTHVTANAGTFNVLGGNVFTPGGPLTDSGVLTVGLAAGDGSQFSGAVTVNSGGTLRGTGTIAPAAGTTVTVNAGGKVMGGQSGAAGILTALLPAGQNLALSGVLGENVSGTVAPDANGLSPSVSRIGLSGGGTTLSGLTLLLDFSGIGTTGGFSNDPNGNGNGFWTNPANYNDAAHDGYVWRVIDAGAGTTGSAPVVTNPNFATGTFGTFLGTGGPLTLTGGGTAGAVYLAFTPTAVPEPASILLAGAAGIGGLLARRRARRSRPS